MRKISVIIPVYDGEKYIAEAIDSILDQSYKDYEIIVVNDGSTDRSEEIIKSYKDKIGYFSQENKGVAEARNLGILNAKGEYIAFLDSDDLWLPQKLEKQVKLVESNKKLGFVYADAYIINDKGKKIGRTFSQAKPYRGKIFSRLFEYSPIVNSTVLVRNECFEKVGLFDSKLSPAEDYDMWLRISYLYEVNYINTPLAKYRINPQGISKKLDVATKAAIEVRKKNSPTYLSLKGNSVFTLNKCFASQYYRSGVSYLEAGFSKKARDCFLKSISFNPLFARSYLFYSFSFFATEIYKRLISKYRRIRFG